MEKRFAGLTLEEIAKTHKDNELVKSLVTEIVSSRTVPKVYSSIYEEALILAEKHPSKDARCFARNVANMMKAYGLDK